MALGPAAVPAGRNLAGAGATHARKAGRTRAAVCRQPPAAPPAGTLGGLHPYPVAALRALDGIVVTAGAGHGRTALGLCRCPAVSPGYQPDRAFRYLALHERGGCEANPPGQGTPGT